MFDLSPTPPIESGPPEPDPRDEREAAEDAFSCTLCGSPMVGVHCKLLCSNCGYREDCSDLFRA